MPGFSGNRIPRGDKIVQYYARGLVRHADMV